VDSTAADLGKVQDKVDLAMTYSGRVQDEHAQVTRHMHSLSGASNVSASDGIMGASPCATLSASATMTSPPPPPPPPPLSHSSDRISRGN
jgi:hypothetical protein